jgi:hypothetical protein
MLDGALLLWYLLTAGSLVYLAYDLFTNTPTTWVMKLAWFLVVLYTGPIGLFIFLLSCRQPMPGTHDQFIAAHWKQSVGSLMHCVAGDATGIILAAALTFRARFPTGIDMLIEYASGFLVGLFVFQALFMKLMTNKPYFRSVRDSFFPETVSMNMVMVGMIPTKFILMHHIAGSDNPLRPEFWGIMSVATMVGMLTAYPINSWMVRRGVKHGMMSAMPPASMATMPAMPMPAGGNMGAMPAAGAATMTSHRGGASPAAVSQGQKVALLVLTTLLFAAAVLVTSFFVPLPFT